MRQSIPAFLSLIRNCIISGLCILSLTPYSAPAQQITNLIFPTEEELLVALTDGELSIEEYLAALDLYWRAPVNVSDSVSLRDALGNLAPNVDLTADQHLRDLDELQREQVSGTVEQEQTRKSHSVISGQLRAYTDQELSALARSRSVYQLSLGARGRWSFSGTLAESYGGEPLWRRRSVVYDHGGDSRRELSVGTFQPHWGLGLAVGRRSQLLRSGSDETTNTFLYPQQGGFNGLRYRGSTGALSKLMSFDLIASIQENEEYQLAVAGAALSTVRGRNMYQAMYTQSKLRSVITHGAFEQRQVALGFHRKSGSSHMQGEIDVQFNRNYGAAVAWAYEGRHQRVQENVRWALWQYSNDFVNLIGGGRAGALSGEIALRETEFTFRDRRVKQLGGLLRSSSRLGEKHRLQTALAVARGRGADQRSDLQLALEQNVHKGATLQLEYGFRIQRFGPERHWVSLQLRQSAAGDLWRAGVKYYRLETERHGLSLFGRWRKQLASKLLIDFWANLSRYSLRGPRERRFFGYMRLAAPLLAGSLGERMLIATKLAYQYQRTDVSASRVIARLEMEARW